MSCEHKRISIDYDEATGQISAQTCGSCGESLPHSGWLSPETLETLRRFARDHEEQ